LAVLRSDDRDLLDVVAAAAQVRQAYFGNRVKLNYLVNMKSVLCGEDCSYCSQPRGSQAGVLKCNWLIEPRQVERLVEAGAYAYNHNLNTAASHYESICSNHSF